MTRPQSPDPVQPAQRGRAVDDEDPNRPFNPEANKVQDPHPSDEEHPDRIPHPGGVPLGPQKDR